ncbi:MAG: ethanolamine ammonia-lyase subunit EutC [Desulfovibrio sp.]|jgi:ethanolamine ammonia-lyase small subunit|nr:ethanolamine ammonia-lyase subunit EutC [Desulfovibrio sp.]
MTTRPDKTRPDKPRSPAVRPADPVAESAASPLTRDAWAALRVHTDARIALGRAGVSLPTAACLDFQLAHARARDAVHLPLAREELFAGLETLFGALGLPLLELRSRVRDRQEYLVRPDLGRRLDDDSSARLHAAAAKGAPRADGTLYDLAIVIADGLSTAAIQRQAVPFLHAFLPLAAARGLALAPPCFVDMGRVAVGDDAGQCLKAKAVAVLIGERPGLSSPDSMGIYMTHAPSVGLTDERRNCISNIRPEGFPPAQAARTLDYLLGKSLALGLSGVNLKDDQVLDGAGAPAAIA